MKVYVTSDLHLEFADLDIENRDQVDVLILSGDICVAADIGRPNVNTLGEHERSHRVKNFFRRCSERFPHVVFVMGNHEHYHGDFVRTHARLQSMLDQANLTNVYLLDKSSRDIDGWLFIGGTLWTDYNGGDPVSMIQAKDRINDHHNVKNSAVSFYRFLPEHARSDHQNMVAYICDTIDQRRAGGDNTARVVVVGHHAPSRLSTHPRYQDDHHLNGAYSTNLESFILDHPEIRLWTHGHTHEDFDYEIGATRIVCNPRGYVGYEHRTLTWQPKLVKL